MEYKPLADRFYTAPHAHELYPMLMFITRSIHGNFNIAMYDVPVVTCRVCNETRRTPYAISRVADFATAYYYENLPYFDHESYLYIPYSTPYRPSPALLDIYPLLNAIEIQDYMRAYTRLHP